MRRLHGSSPPHSALPLLLVIALFLSVSLPCLASSQQKPHHRAPVILSDLFNRSHLPNYRLSPRAVHTYSDLTVAVVFEILPPLLAPHNNNRIVELRLHPFFRVFHPPTKSVDNLLTLLPLRLPCLAVVRFHRVTTAVRWAFAFTGLQPGSAASLLEPRVVHYPHLFLSARRVASPILPGVAGPSPSPSATAFDTPSVLARITRGGRLTYFKMIDPYFTTNHTYSDADANGEQATILTNRIRLSTTTTASGMSRKTIALLAQYPSHASVLLVDAQQGDLRDVVKLSSRSQNLKQEEEHDSTVDAHRVLDHDMWRSTTCTLGAVYASSVLPATGLRLQCHDLRQQRLSIQQHIGLKRATTTATRAVLQFSRDLSTTPASAFARGAKLVILPATKNVCLAASSSSSGIAGRGITAVTLYERAFNFDWHSRDLDATSRAHELIVSVCTSCRHNSKMTASRCDEIILALPEAAAFGGVDALSPLFTIFDVQKAILMKRGAGVRRRRRKRSVVALFATTVQLTGKVNKQDGQWTMEVTQSKEGGNDHGHVESTWMLVIDLESLTPRLMRVDPQVVGKDNEQFDRLRVNAFRVTTSNSKIVLAGLVEGGGSSGTKTGRVKSVTKQQLRSSLYAGGLMTYSVLL